MHPTAADDAMRGFVRHLRLNGYPLGIREAADALSTLTLFPPQRISQARQLLRPLLSGDRGEWTRFDELFDAYWLGRGVRAAQPAQHSPATRNLWSAQLPQLADADWPITPAASGDADDDDSDSSDSENDNARALDRRHGSRRSATAAPSPDTAADKQQLQQCGAMLAAALCRRRSRRLTPAKRGIGVDIRRTLRKNISAGGEPLRLLRRARKPKTAQLTVLLDVSASMKDHFGFFLFLLKGMLSAAATVEVFIFHTRLVRVTSSLTADGGGAKTLEKFALQTQGVGGGTRIAGCLHDFMRAYGSRCLGGRRSVLVISDGYDGDGDAALPPVLAALRRRVPRLLWLSPALAADTQPRRLPQALAAAADHLSALAPARTIADLKHLPRQWRNLP